MAGHSKWANTKHRKATQAAKRSKIFTKIIRELITATKLGGGDTHSNPRLRAAVDKALSNNMTRNTVNQAISRGLSSGYHHEAHMELIYEGYGPGGTAVMVECISNNRNRTTSEVRYAFNKARGNLGPDGSVSYLFSKTGIISFSPDINEDMLMNAALEVGANELIPYEDGAIDIHTTPESFHEVKDSFEKMGLLPQSSKITIIPSIRVSLEKDTAQKLFHFIQILEDFDDVQEVYHNGVSANPIMMAMVWFHSLLWWISGA